MSLWISRIFSGHHILMGTILSYVRNDAYYHTKADESGYPKDKFEHDVKSLCDIVPYTKGGAADIRRRDIQDVLLELWMAAGRKHLDFGKLVDCFAFFLLHGTFTYSARFDTTADIARYILMYHKIYQDLYTVMTCSDFVLKYPLMEPPEGVAMYGSSNYCLYVPKCVRNFNQHSEDVISSYESRNRMSQIKSARNQVGIQKN